MCILEVFEVSELSPLLDDLPSLRLEEIAVRLGVSFATVQRMYGAGDLHAVRISAKALRVKPSELARLLSQREHEPRMR